MDLHAIAFDASGRLLAGTDVGVHRSDNAGNAWRSLNEGLSIAQFYPSVSIHPSDENFFLGGLQDNGTARRGSNGTWSRVLGADGGYTALHPDSPNILFSQTQHTGNLFKSTNGGKNFQDSSSGINSSDRDAFMCPTVFDPNDPNVLFYGTHRIYRSTNLGDSWSAISGDLTDGGPLAAIRAIAWAPSDSSIVYASTTDGKLLVGDDGGTQWTARLTDLGDWSRITRDITIAQWDVDTAYMGVPRFGVDQVLKTADRGESWTALDGDLPDIPVNAVDVHRSETGDIFLFIGTDRDVRISCDEGGHWTTLADADLPNTIVTEVRYQPDLERLVVATQGRGAGRVENAAPEEFSEICASNDDDDDGGEDDDDGDDGSENENGDTSDHDSGSDDDLSGCGCRSNPRRLPVGLVALSGIAAQLHRRRPRRAPSAQPPANRRTRSR
ncbi:MAG: hypothetical protein V3V08_05995 [Nannocystaceae bacterium]